MKVKLGDKRYSLQAIEMKDRGGEILSAYKAKYEADHPDIIAGFPAVEEMGKAMRVFRLQSS